MSRRSVRASFVPHTDRQQGPGCGPCSHVAEIPEGRERLGEDTAPNAVSGDSHEEGGAGAQGGRGRGADCGAHTRAEGESPAQVPSDTPDGAGATGGIRLRVCGAVSTLRAAGRGQMASPGGCDPVTRGAS